MSISPDNSDQTVVLRQPVAPRAATELDELHPCLVVVEGDEPGRLVPLGATPVTIGRDPARDLVLRDSDVSRLHAHIVVAGDQVIVEDHRSTNGTFINGQRLTGPTALEESSVLQVGAQVLKLERRSKRDAQRSEELDRDLEKASRYVRSLLPAPLTDGPVRTEWFYLPSTRLGGDVFGYDWLDPDTLALYLIDVSGHGVGAAMHSVSLLNVLRQRALPNTDLREPAAVLAELNAMFQMERHSGMFFTMWYGVYRVAARTLRYACAGHHAAYLVSGDRRTSTALKTPGLMIGAAPEARYREADTPVPQGSSLYVFSDGVFEVVTADQKQWGLHDLLPVMLAPPPPGESDADRIYRAVKAIARPGPLDDDFSILVVTFP